MNIVVVKKPRSHRIVIRIFLMLCLLLPGIFALCFHQDLGPMVLGCSPALAAMVCLCLYYETWAIHFDRETIQKHILWIRKPVHRYQQIKQVVSVSFGMEGPGFRIIFTDHHMIQFRMADENAHKAKAILLRHTSIRSSLRRS